MVQRGTVRRRDGRKDVPRRDDSNFDGFKVFCALVCVAFVNRSDLESLESALWPSERPLFSPLPEHPASSSWGIFASIVLCRGVGVITMVAAMTVCCGSSSSLAVGGALASVVFHLWPVYTRTITGLLAVPCGALAVFAGFGILTMKVRSDADRRERTFVAIGVLIMCPLSGLIVWLGWTMLPHFQPQCPAMCVEGEGAVCNALAEYTEHAVAELGVCAVQMSWGSFFAWALTSSFVWAYTAICEVVSLCLWALKSPFLWAWSTLQWAWSHAWSALQRYAWHMAGALFALGALSELVRRKRAADAKAAAKRAEEARLATRRAQEAAKAARKTEEEARRAEFERGPGGDTLFDEAIKAGDLDEVQRLATPTRLQRTDSHGRLPIHWASCCGQLAVVKWLRKQHSVPLDVTDGQGWQPMHFACWQGHLDVAKWLRSQGMTHDVASAKTDNNPLSKPTDLIWEAQNVEASGKEWRRIRLLSGNPRSDCNDAHNCYTLVETSLWLKEMNFDKFWVSDKFWKAVSNGDIDTVKRLSLASPWLIRPNAFFHAFLHMACDTGQLEMGKWLHSQGALLDAKDTNGDLPIHLALRQERTCEKDVWQSTPATKNVSLDMVKWLHSQGGHGPPPQGT